jgi:hypothetical protein
VKHDGYLVVPECVGLLGGEPRPVGYHSLIIAPPADDERSTATDTAWSRAFGVIRGATAG